MTTPKYFQLFTTYSKIVLCRVLSIHKSIIHFMHFLITQISDLNNPVTNEWLFQVRNLWLQTEAFSTFNEKTAH